MRSSGREQQRLGRTIVDGHDQLVEQSAPRAARCPRGHCASGRRCPGRSRSVRAVALARGTQGVLRHCRLQSRIRAMAAAYRLTEAAPCCRVLRSRSPPTSSGPPICSGGSVDRLCSQTTTPEPLQQAAGRQSAPTPAARLRRRTEDRAVFKSTGSSECRYGGFARKGMDGRSFRQSGLFQIGGDRATGVAARIDQIRVRGATAERLDRERAAARRTAPARAARRRPPRTVRPAPRRQARARSRAGVLRRPASKR